MEKHKTGLNEFTDDDIEYYETVWGFTPSRDPDGRNYSVVYPLVDIYLEGYSIEATTRACKSPLYDQGFFCRNTITVKKGTKFGTINCVHTAIMQTTVAHIGDLDEERIVEIAKSTEHAPSIELTPEEHFASLKSYVAAIADTGITAMILGSYQSDTMNPIAVTFGFNSLMQSQVMRAIKNIEEEKEYKDYVSFILSEIENIVPTDWFKTHKTVIEDVYKMGNPGLLIFANNNSEGATASQIHQWITNGNYGRLPRRNGGMTLVVHARPDIYGLVDSIIIPVRMTAQNGIRKIRPSQKPRRNYTDSMDSGRFAHELLSSVTKSIEEIENESRQRKKMFEFKPGDQLIVYGTLQKREKSFIRPKLRTNTGDTTEISRDRKLEKKAERAKRRARESHLQQKKKKKFKPRTTR